MVVEGETDGGLQIDLRVPAELLLHVGDGGHALLDVMVIFAEILAGGDGHDLGVGGVFAIFGIVLERGDDVFRQLRDAHVVLRVAEVEDLAGGPAVLVLDDAEKRVDAVVDEGEGAALHAAIDELDGFLEDDVRDELREEARAALLLLEDIVELRPDPVERPEKRVVDVVAHAIGVDDAVEELLRAGVDPALLVDGSIDHVGGRLVQLAIGGHAVDLGGGGKDDALLVFRALADDGEVGLEIELEDAQWILHVLGRVGDGDERDDGVALLHVILDPLVRDHDVALNELETRVAEGVAQLVVADVHAVDLPVFLFQDRVSERTADEAIGAEDEDFEWHGREGLKELAGL